MTKETIFRDKEYFVRKTSYNQTISYKDYFSSNGLLRVEPNQKVGIVVGSFSNGGETLEVTVNKYDDLDKLKTKTSGTISKADFIRLCGLD